MAVYLVNTFFCFTPEPSVEASPSRRKIYWHYILLLIAASRRNGWTLSDDCVLSRLLLRPHVPLRLESCVHIVFRACDFLWYSADSISSLSDVIQVDS